MAVEIEAKLKVDSLPQVERKLKELGAEFVAQQQQVDYLFDDAAETLTSGDRCLRIRRQSAGGNQRYILAYKGPKERSNFKKRQEIEVQITDPDAAQHLLAALTYEKVLTVEKTRRLWRIGGCEVALDHLPMLGDFVEIEGPGDSQIADVQKSLGLAGVPHIPKSYAQLIIELNRGGA